MIYNQKAFPGIQLGCCKSMFLKLGVCWCVLGSPENGFCHGLNVSVLLPKNAYVEILAPKVIIFGGGASERRLGHEGGALVNGICALTKGTSGRPLIPSATGGHSSKTLVYKPGSWSSADTELPTP